MSIFYPVQSAVSKGKATIDYCSRADMPAGGNAEKLIRFFVDNPIRPKQNRSIAV
jgi:hypothetical protein